MSLYSGEAWVKESVSPECLNAQEPGTPLKIDLGEVEADAGV